MKCKQSLVSAATTCVGLAGAQSGAWQAGVGVRVSTCPPSCYEIRVCLDPSVFRTNCAQTRLLRTTVHIGAEMKHLAVPVSKWPTHNDQVIIDLSIEDGVRLGVSRPRAIPYNVMHPPPRKTRRNEANDRPMRHRVLSTNATSCPIHSSTKNSTDSEHITAKQ
jgi:hypothetical protein